MRSPTQNHDVEMGQLNGCNRNEEETQLFGSQTTVPPPSGPEFGAMFGGSKKVTKPHPAELVDQASRGLFPLGFTICNLAYWLYYLYFTDVDLASMQENVHDL